MNEEHFAQQKKKHFCSLSANKINVTLNLLCCVNISINLYSLLLFTFLFHLLPRSFRYNCTLEYVVLSSGKGFRFNIGCAIAGYSSLAWIWGTDNWDIFKLLSNMSLQVICNNSSPRSSTISFRYTKTIWIHYKTYYDRELYCQDIVPYEIYNYFSSA